MSGVWDWAGLWWRDGRRGGERGLGARGGGEMPSQLINTCVCLLEVREVTVTLVTSIKNGGNQGSYKNSFVTSEKK